MTRISREVPQVEDEKRKNIPTTKTSSNSSSSSSSSSQEPSPTVDSKVISSKKSKKKPRSTQEMILRYLALAFFAAALFWFSRTCSTFFKWIGNSFKTSREAKNMRYATAIAREEAIRAWISSSAKQH